MIADQVIEVIEVLAEKLGVAVENVYPMLLQQSNVFRATYHVGLWIGLISFAILVIAGILAIIGWGTDSEICFVVGMVCMILAGFVFMICGINALCDLTQYMTAIHNPEWWVIDYAMKLLK